MQVVYYLQAGDPHTGPIRIDTCATERLRMTIGALQRGNAELLLLRALYEGDAGVLVELRLRHRAHRIHDAWHTAAVLDELPGHLARVDFDEEAERRKVAVRTMQTLASRSRP